MVFFEKLLSFSLGVFLKAFSTVKIYHFFKYGCVYPNQFGVRQLINFKYGCSLQGLPVHFCKTHLPKHDEYITLVDENGDEFQTKYLALKTGLSGGWRGYALDHELIDGDALVFQLVAPTRFKVN